MKSLPATINHHPDSEQLIDYIAGALPMSHALCISTHLESCPICQQQHQKLQAIGSSQFDRLPGSVIPARLKEKTLSTIHTLKAEPPVNTRALSDGTPDSIKTLISSDLEELPWKTVTRDVGVYDIHKEPDGTRVALVRVVPGGRMAHHSHTGDEITVILKGSFSDEDGIYQKGDYVFRDSKHKHTPVASHDQSCICLIVLNGAIQLTGFFSPLINPVLRLMHRI